MRPHPPQVTLELAARDEIGKRQLVEHRRAAVRKELGGRARSMDGPYKANLGPHALLSSSPFWGWLGERDLLPPYARPPLSGVRFRWRDDIRRVPAVGAAVAALRLRGSCGAGRSRLSHVGGRPAWARMPPMRWLAAPAS